MRGALLSLLLPVALPAAVNGLPLASRPEVPSPYAFVFANDAFGAGVNLDDHRTTHLAMQGLVGPVVLHADYSVLTRRGPRRDEPDPPGSEGRIDEATISLGRQFDLATRWGATWLAVGGSLRVRGDLGGEAVQNGWHTLIGVRRVHLPYEDVSEGAGGGFASVSHRVWWGVDLPRTPFDRVGLWLRGQGLALVDEEADACISADLVFGGSQAHAWIGLRSELRHGDGPDPTTDAARDNEEGPQWQWGVSIHHLSMEFSRSLENGRGYGQLVWETRKIPPEDAGVADGRMDVVIGAVAIDGFQSVVGGRWSCGTWGADRAVSLRPALAVDHRFGEADEPTLADCQRTIRQWDVLFDLELAADAGWWSYVRPYVAAGAGLRRESLRRRQYGDRVEDPGCTRVVAQIDAGARLHLFRPCTRSWRNSSLDVAAGLTLPSALAHTDWDGVAVDYQEPGASLVVGLSLGARF